jgi:hypothetical protein
VRVGAHVQLHQHRLATRDQLAATIGPFFWNYWSRAGVMALVEKCIALDARQPSPFGPPYYVASLRALEEFSEQVGGARLGPEMGDDAVEGERHRVQTEPAES